MNKELADAIIVFIHTLGSSMLFRGVLGTISGLILVSLVHRIRKKEVGPPVVFVVGVVAISLLVFAVFPQIADIIIKTEYTIRMRLFCGGISLLVLLVTFEALRTSWLEERYALLWLGTSAAMLFVAVYPKAFVFLRLVHGGDYLKAILILVFAFVLFVCFYYSIALSQHQARNDSLAREHALLEQRMVEMETEIKALRESRAAAPGKDQDRDETSCPVA